MTVSDLYIFRWSRCATAVGVVPCCRTKHDDSGPVPAAFLSNGLGVGRFSAAYQSLLEMHGTDPSHQPVVFTLKIR